jgi:hypothetical protein
MAPITLIACFPVETQQNPRLERPTKHRAPAGGLDTLLEELPEALSSGTRPRDSAVERLDNSIAPSTLPSRVHWLFERPQYSVGEVAPKSRH